MRAPTRLSRHRFTRGLTDEAGREHLSDREPFGYRDYPDNRVHVVRQGDTWWGLAATYFTGVEDAALLWWVLCDFQPEPVSDPTLALEPGVSVIVPSTQVLLGTILSESRRRVPEVPA